MRVLLTFTGFHDPFWSDGVQGSEQEGPILSLLRSYPVDRVFLFSTPNTAEITEGTARAILDRHPGTIPEVVYLPLKDPTSYAEILARVRDETKRIRRELANAEYFVATASGTPQMHSCWVLLVASGEIPAKLLHVRPPRFVTPGELAVTEVDLNAEGFPTVRPPSVIRPRLETAEQDRSLAETVRDLGIIGDHAKLTEALESAALIAQSDVPALILGESGTGKEKVAHLIHRLSKGNDRLFVPINCAAIPATLVESALFGHKKGAFTGADRDYVGAFGQAHGGTLFLDEFAELSLDIQAKLLRAVEYGEVPTVGVVEPKKVNVRLIVATNKNLKDAIASGNFREDLYYRVDIGRIVLPPLRERRSDIVKLALYFLDLQNQKYERRRSFAPEALLIIESQPWPGNVRELENTIIRAALLARDGVITANLVSTARERSREASIPEPHPGFSMPEYLAEARDRLVERALQKANGNRSEAARLLGVTPQSISQHLSNRGR